MARSMLGHNLDSINPDGTITPAHRRTAALRRTRPRRLRPRRISTAPPARPRSRATTSSTSPPAASPRRCSPSPPRENGLAYASLGLLSFGPSKERNPVWERLVEETRQRIDKPCSTAATTTTTGRPSTSPRPSRRFSLGLSKKDETSRLIERMVERIDQTSSAGFFDDADEGPRRQFQSLRRDDASCSSAPRCSSTPTAACAIASSPPSAPTPRNTSR